MSSFWLAVIDATPKDRCINNNNVRTPNGNHYGNQQPNGFVSNVTATAPIQIPIRCTKGQHQSNSNQVTMPAPEDGSVLKKVISFTLDQMNNADGTTEKTSSSSSSRPSFVPEKLHFSAYEQFKGEFTWVLYLSLTCYIDINQFDRVANSFFFSFDGEGDIIIALNNVYIFQCEVGRNDVLIGILGSRAVFKENVTVKTPMKTNNRLKEP